MKLVPLQDAGMTEGSLKNPVVLLIPLLAAISFGVYPGAARIAYADGANATFVLVVTTFVRAVALILFCLATKKTLMPAPEEQRVVLWGGFFQALSIFGIIASLVYIPGPVAIILVFTSTILLLFLLAYKGEIKLTKFALISTLTALLGVSLVVDVWGNIENLSWIGISLAMLSSFATVIRIYIFGKQVQKTNPALVGARIFSIALLFMLILAPINGMVLPSSSAGWMGVVWCSLSLTLGTFCMFYGIALVGTFRYTLMAKLEPLCTAFFSYLLLGEVLNGYQYVGMVVVIASLAGYQYYDGRAKFQIPDTAKI